MLHYRLELIEESIHFHPGLFPTLIMIMIIKMSERNNLNHNQHIILLKWGRNNLEEVLGQCSVYKPTAMVRIIWWNKRFLWRLISLSTQTDTVICLLITLYWHTFNTIHILCYIVQDFQYNVVLVLRNHMYFLWFSL